MKNREKFKEFFNGAIDDLSNEPHCSNRSPRDAIISVKFEDGHIHHLLPDEEISKEIAEDLTGSLGITSSPKKKESLIPTEPVIFKNRQALGDILMMTCSIRDFANAFPDCPVGVSTTAMHIWDHNPHLDRSLTPQNTRVIEIGPGWLTNASNRDDRHFANAFRISIEEKLGVSIPQGLIKPDIWMTEEECSSPIIEPPYWVIVAGEKGDWTAKTYPFSRWQEVVSNYPNMKFVQVGAKEHRHPKLRGDNIIDLIGKTQDRNTGIRDLFRLFYFAEGSMGLVSFQMHLAAAFGMPCVVIAGAREPARFTRFPGHQYLCTDGCLPCASHSACWHCNLEKTCPEIVEVDGQKIPKCVEIIKTEDVIRAIDQYYEGGRLSFDHPRTPTGPNGKVRAPVETISMVPENYNAENKIISSKEEEILKKTGYNWKGSQITEKDWIFLKEAMERYEVKNVLEFGPGLSTFLMKSLGADIVSYESDEKWLRKTKEKDPSLDIRLWNGKVMQDELPKFDVAIVDGPPAHSGMIEGRKISIKVASEKADIVFVHDASRKGELKWQDAYLKDKFNGPTKGGNGFHLWIRKDSVPDLKKDAKPTIVRPPVRDSNGVFRIVFNGRGEGGAESSTTWIMNEFVKMGWEVQYVYPGQSPSGTFRKHGSKEVMATNDMSFLANPCDILLLYVNDWVWEFPKDHVSELMEKINAKRKVMAVNFRLGKIGRIPWTLDWDSYLFLNSYLGNAFKTAYMETKGDTLYSFKARSMAPPIDLTKFLEKNINYEGELRIVRHSSQGNTKYAKDFNEKVKRIIEEFPKVTIRLMPAPTFLENFGDRVISHKRNQPSVDQFLTLGNVFWYDLPDGYFDMGPKVIMEAQAVGLPVIAGNHSGPKDRVISGTGFLGDSIEEQIESLRELNSANKREEFGRRAKEHARTEYASQNWIKEIIGKEN